MKKCGRPHSMYVARSIFSRRNVVAGLALAAFLLVVFGAWTLYQRSLPKGPPPTNFEECAALYPVTGTLPRVCRVPQGDTFVEYQGNFPQVNV